MSGSRSRHNPRPVVVEVKPDTARSPKGAVSSQPTPSSPPKTVRFPSTTSGGPVESISRPLNPTEAWSLYNFETHARECSTCRNPYDVSREGRNLCDSGRGLALDVAIHVYSRKGVVYSTSGSQEHKLVHVEMPANYQQLQGLLKAMERGLRTTQRAVPVVSYDRTYPVSSREQRPRARSPEREREQPRYVRRSAEVVLEPASADRERRHKHNHKHSSSSTSKPHQKSSGYKTVVVNEAEVEDDEDNTYTTAPRRHEKRGSLYEKDMLRKRDPYRVEIREPERRKGKEGGPEKVRRRDSGVYV